nr:MAG: LacI family transcriptional regulator [Bacillota bacterium]
MARKNATIYDIAKLAKTSTATVSRVLSNSGYPVSAELRQRVLEAAKKLNYTPNLLGRQLKTHESMDIGIIIPSITNQFYPLLLLGVEDVARKKGYNVLLCNTLRKPENEKKYLSTLFQKQIKGVIISSITKNQDYLKKLQQKGLKVVAFDQSIPIDCCKINFDFYAGGYMAAEYLIKLGHRKIAFLSAPLTRYSRIKVYEGFMQCMKDNGIEPNMDYVILSEEEEESHDQIYEFKNGKYLINKLLSSGKPMPTAIFCINDMTAFGAIQELTKNKIYVPKDVSVMGFDNIPTSEMITPSLTTIDQSAYEMGTLAAEMLISNLENSSDRNMEIILKPKLVERNSTRRIDDT